MRHIELKFVGPKVLEVRETSAPMETKPATLILKVMWGSKEVTHLIKRGEKYFWWFDLEAPRQWRPFESAEALRWEYELPHDLVECMKNLEIDTYFLPSEK